MLTLIGLGGAGKTRIARRVIAEATEDYPAGVWVVELADFVDPTLLGEIVAGALDLQVPAGGWDGLVLSHFFADRPGLLVLDNCEHVIGAVADLAATLLAACPGLTLLATSRIPLGIRAETVYPVHPLSAPALGAGLQLDDATSYDAVALYVRRATQVLATFALTPENVTAVGQLVAVLDGVPLSIELAAARVRLLAPDALLSRISESFSVLESDLRDVPERQRSLAASVGWSYDLCTRRQQDLWDRLSVFTGGFELTAAEQVCSGDGIEPDDVLGLLSSLVDMSVVGRVGETGSRYRMLETIRQFGAAHLEKAGKSAYWRGRHLDWYAALVESLDEQWIGPDQVAWMDRLRVEHPNLRAALDHALREGGEPRTALLMCSRLEPLWVCGGHLTEARRWLERALAATETSPAETIEALRLCAWFGALQIDPDYARARVEEAGDLVSDDDLSQGHYLFARGIVATWDQDFESGIALLVRSAESYRLAGNLTGELEARLNTGMAHVFAAQYDAAAAICEVVLGVADDLGDSYIAGYARWAAGLGLMMDGDLPDAEAKVRAALTQSSSLGDQLAMAIQLETLAWMSAIQIDVERAVVLLGGAQVIWRMMNMPAGPPGIAEYRALGESELRVEVGEQAFEMLFAKGLAMNPLDVVEFALDVNLPATQKAKAGPLSRRETEVAALVADGLSNRDIAERLFLSERTAQGHVQSILRKLDFGSRSQIAVWFITEARAV